jgi:hypothetical protein
MLHLYIGMELVRQKQADLIAAANASRAAAHTTHKERTLGRRLAGLAQATVLRRWSRRRPVLAGAQR